LTHDDKSSSCIFQVMTLVVDPLARGFPSSTFSSKGFVFKFKGSASSLVPPIKGIRLEMLKVVCIPYFLGKSNMYALSFTLMRTSKGPPPRELSLYSLYLGNLSLLKWSQIQFPSSKITFVFPLLFCFLYLFVCCGIWFTTFSWSFLTNLALDTLSFCINSCRLDRGTKSKWVIGLKPYTTSNWEILIVLWTTLL